MGICPAAENGFGLKWLSKRYWNHSCRRWIAARDRKHLDDGIADILQNVASARYDARHDQIKEGIQELNDPQASTMKGSSSPGETAAATAVAVNSVIAGRLGHSRSVPPTRPANAPTPQPLPDRTAPRRRVPARRILRRLHGPRPVPALLSTQRPSRSLRRARSFSCEPWVYLLLGNIAPSSSFVFAP